MTDSPWLPSHQTQAEAVLSLLKAHPEGVSRSQFIRYLYYDKKGRTVGLGWEARARISELRKDYHIDYDKIRDVWVYRGPKVVAGQLMLAGV